MKKVKKYILETGTDKWLDEKERKELEIRESIFIVEGPKGIVVSYETEGVHWIIDSLDETFEIDVYKKPDETGIPIFPRYKIEVTLRDIINTCEYEKCDVKDMVRKFGSRLDANYALLLESLKKIGLNLEEYDTNR